MQEPYQKSFEVRWADLDPNQHLRHTAYNDYAAHVRMSFLAEKGFTLQKFRESGLGPVLFREDTRYLKEVAGGEIIRIDVQLLSTTPDGSRWKLKHNIYKADGKLAATILLEGAWLDLKLRKLTVPPLELSQHFAGLPQAEPEVEK